MDIYTMIHIYIVSISICIPVTQSNAPRRTDSFSKISLGKLSLKIRDYLTITCLLPFVFGNIGFHWKISFVF